MKRQIRVVIIEDSALMRRELKRILESDPEVEVVGLARNGDEGVALVIRLAPDVVTLDLNLPGMDGLTCLQYIMLSHPCPCVVISAHTGRDSIETFEALELGAVDFVTKPSGEISRDLARQSAEIVKKVKNATLANVSRMQRLRPVQVEAVAAIPALPIEVPRKLVMIGVSTGGPRTLMQIIPALPRDLPAPVVIVQHMPGLFTTSFAARLDQFSQLRVQEASQGELLQNGVAYVAPGNFNLEIVRSEEDSQVRFMLSPPRKQDLVNPCINLAFASAARAFGKQTVAIILTGMGSDGVEAMKQLHALGAMTIAESEQSAVVYGMPQEVVRRGAARIVAPAQKIADHILEAVGYESQPR